MGSIPPEVLPPEELPPEELPPEELPLEELPPEEQPNAPRTASAMRRCERSMPVGPAAMLPMWLPS
jgi:protein TonB